MTVSDSICIGKSISFGAGDITALGIYIDSLQNSIGCDSIVTLNLFTVPNVLKGMFKVSNPSCYNFSDGALEIQSLSSREPYNVQVNLESIASPWSIAALNAGEYRYIISDSYGCEMDTILTITNPPTFDVELGPDQTLILGERFDVSGFLSGSASAYEWQPAAINCQPPCESISEVFNEDVTVSLTAISTDGCFASDDVQVTIKEALSPFIPNAFTPNAFTPNEDGKNDFLLFSQQKLMP